MSGEQAMREAAREAGISALFRFDEVTESTNATALRMAAEGAPEWSLVAADHQTAGRGRLGRTWVSEPGEALLFSLVLRPRIAPAHAGVLTLLAGVAMAEAARISCGAKVRCRWPNDLMVGESKAGGVLAESVVAEDRISYVVLGVGVNVSGAPAEVSEAASLGGGDPAALLSAFLRGFRWRYRPAEPEFADEVLDAWREVSVTLGRRVRAETLHGCTVEGTALDVDERGNLVVDVDGARETVGFGEVAHLDA